MASEADAAKIEAFIRNRGVTLCPPDAPYNAAPARPAGNGGDSSWLSRQHHAPETPEQRLAQAKLLVMMEDLGDRGRGTSPTGIGDTNRLLIREAAHRWFFDWRSDYAWWCDLAGFPPEYIREKARKVYENGIPDLAMMRQGQKLPPMSAEQRRQRRNARGREYQRRRKGGMAW